MENIGRASHNPFKQQQLSNREFSAFSQWIYKEAGIHMTDAKRALVASRLASRLRVLGMANYAAYFEYLNGKDNAVEKQRAINLLTTNETYFFREQAHFDYLRAQLDKNKTNGKFTIWSAACSSGEEVWSLAMTLAAKGDLAFSITGSDINTEVVAKAKRGIYDLSTVKNLSRAHLHKYFLKGVKDSAGTIKVAPELSCCCDFKVLNLLEKLPSLCQFDFIFLRNVMIYFDMPTKQSVINNVLGKLKPGGHLIISHSESLNGIKHELELVKPSIFRLPLGKVR